MRKLISLFGILFSVAVHGQEVDKCDLAILSDVNDKVGNLSKEEMKTFLLTFGRECRKNTEFSEYGNELLFKVLSEQTRETLKAIHRYRKEIDVVEIYEDLSVPIADNIDVNKLIVKIQDLKAPKRHKKEIISSLKVAQTRYGNSLQTDTIDAFQVIGQELKLYQNVYWREGDMVGLRHIVTTTTPSQSDYAIELELIFEDIEEDCRCKIWTFSIKRII
jgi:hypothetical protein